MSNVVHDLIAEAGDQHAFCHNSPLPRPAPWRRSTGWGWPHTPWHGLTRCLVGQQQRVAIARALVRRPALLLADEPAASRDPAAGHEVMALFTRLRQANGTMLLFTSHDMAHARSYADRIVALGDGRVLFDTAADTVAHDMLFAVFHG